MTRLAHRTVIAEPEASVSALVEELTATLRSAGLSDPLRVGTDIVAALLDVPRSWPVFNRDTVLEPEMVRRARSAARRIAAGAPFAYAIGSVAFRHLTLEVDERVLIPRPETELIVDEILARLRTRFQSGNEWGVAVDIGTGSGAIGLALASEGNFSRVIATDSSMDALEVAAGNQRRAGSRLRCPVELRSGWLLSPVSDTRASVVVSNPPYIAYGEIQSLPAAVRDWEPTVALLSGGNGLDATAAIVRDAPAVLVRGGLLALEVDERRASLVAEMVMAIGTYDDVSVKLDLTGRERFVFASRT